jgi:hypothetical protein
MNAGYSLYGSPIKTISLLVLLCFASFLIPASVLHVPLLENEGVYFTIAGEMVRGARLYADVWDHKPPLLFLQAMLTGPLRASNPENGRWCLALVHFVNALLLGAIAVRHFRERRPFWRTAFAYLALAAPPVFHMWSFEADLLMLPWLLAALLAATGGPSAHGWGPVRYGPQHSSPSRRRCSIFRCSCQCVRAAALGP